MFGVLSSKTMDLQILIAIFGGFIQKVVFTHCSIDDKGTTKSSAPGTNGLMQLHFLNLAF